MSRFLFLEDKPDSIIFFVDGSVKIVLCLTSVNHLSVYALMTNVFAWYRVIFNLIHPEVTQCTWWDVKIQELFSFGNLMEWVFPILFVNDYA